MILQELAGSEALLLSSHTYNLGTLISIVLPIGQLCGEIAPSATGGHSCQAIAEKLDHASFDRQQLQVNDP